MFPVMKMMQAKFSSGIRMPHTHTHTHSHSHKTQYPSESQTRASRRFFLKVQLCATLQFSCGTRSAGLDHQEMKNRPSKSMCWPCVGDGEDGPHFKTTQLNYCLSLSKSFFRKRIQQRSQLGIVHRPFCRTRAQQGVSLVVGGPD